jgi:hypothetical protein
MEHNRGLTVHFSDGTSLAFSFPQQTDNAYAAAIAVEEVMKRRILTVEADGALIVIPFDNVKYISAYPGTSGRELKHVIRGATLAD